MKKLLVILLVSISLNAFSQVEQKTHPIGEESTTEIHELVFKHKFQAEYVKWKFKRAYIERTIFRECLVFKCEYHMIISEDDYKLKNSLGRYVLPKRVRNKTPLIINDFIIESEEL